MKDHVTLIDVARAAGVSAGTASRVLNNFADVSPDARQRVVDAVTQLRYHPLRRRKGGGGRHEHQHHYKIGLVLLGMDDTLVHVPVLTEVLHGVESAVNRLNGNLLFANLPNAERVPAFLHRNDVEGLIVKASQYGAFPDSAKNPLIKSILQFPLVWVWAKPENVPGDLCSFNHENAARLAATHLYNHGHRRVAYLNPKKGKSSLEHIKKEFEFACAERGLKLSLLETVGHGASLWPEPALTGPEELLHLVDEWLAFATDRRPTAIFVPADNIAVHLYTALERRGQQVGREVSIISCNNEKAVIRGLKPSLTTIDVGAHRIGSMAVEQLLWRIRNPQDDFMRTVLLETRLEAGDSVVSLPRESAAI